jgi:ABC-type xylose transport system substrate-binding protein
MGLEAKPSVVMFATVCLADFASAADKKVVGTTLLSLQSPFLVTVDNAMKGEAAKEDIDLVSLDPGQSVAKELSQVEALIARRIDLIVMIPVDQKTGQAAAKLVNKAGIPLVLLNTRFIRFSERRILPGNSRLLEFLTYSQLNLQNASIGGVIVHDESGVGCQHAGDK